MGSKKRMKCMSEYIHGTNGMTTAVAFVARFSDDIDRMVKHWTDRLDDIRAFYLNSIHLKEETRSERGRLVKS